MVLTVVSLPGKLTNLYKVESIIYMVLKFKRNKKRRGDLWGEARAFKRTVKMPKIFKRPLKFFFFGLKYFTLNVNGRMSLIHHGHLCNANPCPPFFKKHGELQPSNYYNKCYSLKLKHILAILKLN